MLDPDAPIEPGTGLGGIPIGCRVEEILTTAEPLRVIDLPEAGEGGATVTIHSFGAVRTWSVDGVVEQVGAFEGYRGRTAEGIGIGSTIEEIRAAYGDVVPAGAEGMIECPERPGMGIETTPWTDESHPDPTARVVQLFVHGTEA